MPRFTITPPAERASRWAQARREAAERAGQDTKPGHNPPGNVEAVLGLNGTRYVSHRGRLYRAPPLPVPVGLRIQDHWLRATKAASAGEDGFPGPDYARHLRGLADGLWAALQPGSPALRVLRRLGLLRNPFLRASEAELRDLALFCLGCRTSSTVGYPTTRTAPLSDQGDGTPSTK